MFVCTLIVSPEGWSLSTSSPPGVPVANAEQVLVALEIAAAQVRANMAPPPPVVLPDGWVATDDGVSVNVLLGGPTSHTRNYVRDGVVREAPCGPDGSATIATVEALSVEA